MRRLYCLHYQLSTTSELLQLGRETQRRRERETAGSLGGPPVPPSTPVTFLQILQAVGEQPGAPQGFISIRRPLVLHAAKPLSGITSVAPLSSS